MLSVTDMKQEFKDHLFFISLLQMKLKIENKGFVPKFNKKKNHPEQHMPHTIVTASLVMSASPSWTAESTHPSFSEQEGL